MINYEAVARWSEVVSAFAFAAVIVLAFVKYLSPAVANAQVRANEELLAVARRRDEAKRQLETVRAEQAEVEQAATRIKQRAEQEAIHERERLIAETREAGERLLRNADGELARARIIARDRFRVELIEKSLQLARSEATALVDARRNGELIDRFVDAVERSTAGNGRVASG